MSIRATSDQTRTDNTGDPVLRLAFIGNVHRMLALGYSRLDAPKYHDADENLLTQEFAAALRKVANDAGSPRWAAQFVVHEKQKQNDGKRQGNYRLELDIVLERTQHGRNPTFVIEAKRLGPRHPVTTYLGPKGMGAFISCEYAKEHGDAGMLGYVQSQTMDQWCDSIGRELGAPNANYHVETNGTWQPHAFRGGPAKTYCSRHTRSGNRGAITIYHTLLNFTS